MFSQAVCAATSKAAKLCKSETIYVKSLALPWKIVRQDLEWQDVNLGNICL